MGQILILEWDSLQICGGRWPGWYVLTPDGGTKLQHDTKEGGADYGCAQKWNQDNVLSWAVLEE